MTSFPFDKHGVAHEPRLLDEVRANYAHFITAAGLGNPTRSWPDETPSLTASTLSEMKLTKFSVQQH